jgi:RNase P/RNase MRP subunit POP5
LIKYVRRRYLALKVESEEGGVDQRAVSDAVWNTVLRLFGEVGCSQAGLYLVHFDEEKEYAVLRCSHKALPMVKAAIASITKIDKPAAIHVLRVSGSIKTLSKKVDGGRARTKDLGECEQPP